MRKGAEDEEQFDFKMWLWTNKQKVKETEKSGFVPNGNPKFHVAEN